MKFDVRFIQKKPKALEWLYLLIFGTGLLITVPFVALAIKLSYMLERHGFNGFPTYLI